MIDAENEVDFGEALKKAIRIAKEASFARDEVEKVFERLNRQVIKTSEGRLSIEKGVATVDNRVSDALGPVRLGPGTKAGQLLQQLEDSGVLGRKPRQTYEAILASNPTLPERKPQVIARWSQDPAGYPFTVRWARQEHICETKEALEYCLADLIQDPEVAEILVRVMNAKPAEPTATA